ncbi:MAG: 2-C-methyl-D-erythritol 4-phosphate cytidylyltransferase [Oscillospiraceae bacterium]|nr:2-C-methyl-D-erythritol 4-phosphate cytidylyltransferase [Oscillospiraceae bacterium]MBQ9110957.1 2-C-methyl-D-erythritol 4-phosphate cytidylyltransferase [Oscillospiraceae bacterium]
MSETTTRTPDTSVILVCAGNATRMGGINKILMPLGNTNVIGMCMLAFEQSEDIAEIIVVTKAENNAVIEETAKTLGIRKLTAITEGGSTRQQSVMQGLKHVSKESQYIAIHDGARPLVKPEHIAKVIKDAHVFGGATLGVPVKDTIKVVDDGLIIDTPHRPSLYITQTPQVFRKRQYFEAVDFAMEHNLDFTDDCQLMEAINCRVYMTVGDYTNIKITTPEDREIAEVLL